MDPNFYFCVPKSLPKIPSISKALEGGEEASHIKRKKTCHSFIEEKRGLQNHIKYLIIFDDEYLAEAEDDLNHLSAELKQWPPHLLMSLYNTLCVGLR